MPQSATPKAMTVSQSVRVRPRARGRARTTKTRAAVAIRSHTMPVGSILPNRFFATAAPSCAEAIPASTTHTGEIGRRGMLGEPRVSSGGSAIPLRAARQLCVGLGR